MGVTSIPLVFLNLILSFNSVIGYENVTDSITTINALNYTADYNTSTINVEVETTTTYDSNTEQIPNQEPSNEYSPFQVSLHLSYDDSFICGGSIISPKTVLTAAHCMYYKWGGIMPPLIVQISAGRPNLNETAWRTFEVVNITLHPLFNKTSMDNDLALIEISERFETNNLVSQIDLEKHMTNQDYNNCVVTGWNLNSYGFQVMEVVLVSCINYPRNFCTNKKYPQSTQCINNAGNPLVCDGKLIGVLSVESECEDPNQLFIFEKIRHSMAWLNESIGNVSSTTKMIPECTWSLFLVYMFLKTVIEVD